MSLTRARCETSPRDPALFRAGITTNHSYIVTVHETACDRLVRTARALPCDATLTTAISQPYTQHEKETTTGAPRARSGRAQPLGPRCREPRPSCCRSDSSEWLGKGPNQPPVPSTRSSPRGPHLDDSWAVGAILEERVHILRSDEEELALRLLIAELHERVDSNLAVSVVHVHVELVEDAERRRQELQEATRSR